MEFELNPTAWPTLFDSHGRMLFEYVVHEYLILTIVRELVLRGVIFHVI